MAVLAIAQDPVVRSIAIVQENQILPTAIVKRWPGNQELEAKLRAANLRRMFVSTRMLALRDPQLNPVVVPVADGYAVFHGATSMSSFAREMGTSRAITALELSALERFYADHACRVRLWISDRTHGSLVKLLDGRGYAVHSRSLTWLCPVDRAPIRWASSNIEIVPVTVPLYAEWIRTVASGFFEESESALTSAVPLSHFDLFFALGCAPDDQAFLARMNGEYVGGAVLNVADGIAMLRTASTRFSHRNRGVEQTLLYARLQCAREQGARLAVAQTPPWGPSAHNLKKLGFEPFRCGCIMEKERLCR